MDQKTRQSAIAAYRERKSSMGVYAVRCVPGNQIWVGDTLTLATVQNRHWFALRHGSHQNPEMQAAWVRAGEAGFTYEILEEIDPDEPPYRRATLLAQKRRDWCVRLGAPPI